jgi:lipopolysaccharide heptosyltransferase I
VGEVEVHGQAEVHVEVKVGDAGRATLRRVRILLTRLSAMGDIVHTFPLAAALAANVERLELAWVVEAPFLPLVAHHPAVTDVIPVATRKWRRSPLSSRTREEVREAIRNVSSFAPEVALDPQGLTKSAAWTRLARARRRIGLVRGVRREALAGLFYNETVQPPSGIRHVVDLNLSLLASLGISPPYGAAPDARFLLAAAPGTAWRPLGTAVAVLPATAGRGKAWPPGQFAELARRVVAHGRPVVVVWGPGEEDVAREVAALAGSGAEVAPRTSLIELAWLLSGCAAVVGGDSGPTHLAAGLGVPTLAVHLRTDPGRNGPLGRHVETVAQGPTDGAAGQPARPASGVTVEVVVAKLERLLLAAQRELEVTP